MNGPSVLNFGPDAARLAAMARESQSRGALDEALDLWTRAAALDPANGDYFLGLTDCMARAGRVAAAIEACDAAVSRLAEPNLAWLRKGALQHSAGDKTGALASLEAVLATDPDNPLAHEQMGRIHLERLDLAAARRHGELALARCDIGRAPGIRTWLLNDYEGVIDLCAQLLLDNPTDSGHLVHRGRALQMMGRLDEALAMYARGAEQIPAAAGSVYGLAETLLLLGDREAGWRRFDSLANDAVLMSLDPRIRPTLATYWRGQSLSGKRILVVHFLGIGDNIMFARYARTLRDLGARVTFCCRPELFRLFAGLEGVDDLRASYHDEPWTNFDFWTFDFTMPRWLGAPRGHIPAEPGGYIAKPATESPPAPPLPRGLRGADRLRVGLCWSSAPGHFTAAARFLKPEDFRPLADLPGVDWFVVQKGPYNAGFAARSGLPAADFSDQWTDFRDTAALMGTLDLVISICSAPLHLAGALGIPAWGLICAAPDWRWGVTGSTSPWYSRLRLFRQKRLHDWGPVVAEVKAALSACAPGSK